MRHGIRADHIAPKLPRRLLALDRTLTADEADLPETLIHTDKNKFSPRVGLAWRVDQSNKTVPGRVRRVATRPSPVQGIRDLLATNEFRFTKPGATAGCRTGSQAEPSILPILQ